MIKTQQGHKSGKWILSGLMISTLLLSGCDSDQTEQRPQIPPAAVSVYDVQTQKVGGYSEYIGRSEAINVVDIRARVEGFLVKRNFTEGSMVDKNQLLYELDRAPFEAALKGAKAKLSSSQANLVNARKSLERSQDLIKSGAISQSDLDMKISTEAQALAAVESAQAELDSAKLNLSYTRISAPFKGRIGKSTYSVGNLVGPNSKPLATLTSMDPIYVIFQMDERQLVSHLTKNAQTREVPDIESKSAYDLTLKLPNGETYDQPGTFSFADTKVDESMGTLTLRATFPNPQGILLPGLYVTLQAESTDKKSVPIIPQAAVQQDQSGYFVLLVTPDNAVKMQQVELGRRLHAMWAVKSGLKPGDKIIVEGLQKVRPGAQVAPTVVTVDPTVGTITIPSDEKQEQGH